MRRDVLLPLPALGATALLLLILRSGGGEDALRVPPPPEPSAAESAAAPAPVATPVVEASPGPSAPATPIAGRVEDAAGAPVPGAEVVAVTPASGGAPARVLRAVTDAEGRFVLEEATPGAWSLTASAAGFVPATRRDVAAGTPDLRLVLPAQGSIDVTLLGPEGAPWDGAATITAQFVGFAAGGAPAEALPGGSVRTLEGAGGPGVRRLAGLPAGTWRVEAVATGEPPLVSEGTGVSVGVVDGRPSPASLRLVRAGRLEGTVVDATGAPAGTTSILGRLEGRAGTAGAASVALTTPPTGTFAADGLAAGTWRFAGRAASGGFVRARIEIGPGETVRRDLEAHPPGAVRARLTHEDGTPAVGVTVVLESEDGLWKELDGDGTRPATLSFRSDEHGVQFREAVPAGRLRLTTRPDRQHGSSAETAVEVPAGGTAEVEVVVPRRHGPGR